MAKPSLPAARACRISGAMPAVLSLAKFIRVLASRSSSFQRLADLLAASPQPRRQRIEKRTKLRRRMPAIRINHMDGYLVSLIAAQQPHQPLVRQRIGRLVTQHAGDTESRDRRIDRRFGSVDNEPRLDQRL